MLGKLKELLSDWKVSVTLLGGALVVATVFGTCTFEPDVAMHRKMLKKKLRKVMVML